VTTSKTAHHYFISHFRSKQSLSGSAWGYGNGVYGLKQPLTRFEDFRKVEQAIEASLTGPDRGMRVVLLNYQYIGEFEVEGDGVAPQ
jgi:hypothetical protein